MQAEGAVRAAGELTPLVRLFRANWRPVTLTYALLPPGQVPGPPVGSGGVELPPDGVLRPGAHRRLTGAVLLLAGLAAGDIYAVFAYIEMFVVGLDCVPMLTQQLARLHDIGGRVALEDGE